MSWVTESKMGIPKMGWQVSTGEVFVVKNIQWPNGLPQ